MVIDKKFCGLSFIFDMGFIYLKLKKTFSNEETAFIDESIQGPLRFFKKEILFLFYGE
jgi:hypothetical protein